MEVPDIYLGSINRFYSTMTHMKFKVLLIITITAISSTMILATGPSAELSEYTEQIAAVNVKYISPDNFTPSYQAHGRTEAVDKLAATAQVEGRVTYVNKAFIEGGEIEKGDIVFQIDDSEYAEELHKSVNELKIAKAMLQVELGEQKVAAKEFEQVFGKKNNSSEELQKALMLRTPQLEQAKARVEIAQSQVNLARNNLSKTKYISDKDYSVISKSINIGDFVAKGDLVGELASLSVLRIGLAMPRSIATQLTLEQEVNLSSEHIKSQLAFVSQISPVVHEKSQLQEIYVVFDNSHKQFILGEFVEVQFNLSIIENTLKLPLVAIHDDLYWTVNQQGKLASHPVNILWQDENHAFVESSSNRQEKVVVSRLFRAKEGDGVSVIQEYL